MSLEGDRALVGAYRDDDDNDPMAEDSGSAYVFVRSGSTWVQAAKLVAADAAANDRFGLSVSLSGDRALVGASGDDDGEINSGSAYVFGSLPVSTEGAAEARFDLAAPRPNPVRASADVSFSLAEAGRARLSLFDLLGRKVAVLFDGERAAGSHTEALDASGLAPGVYVVRLVVGAEARTQRLVVVR